MGADDIGAGRIDDRQTFFFRLRTDGIADTMGSEDDNTFIDLIEQFETAFLRIFDKTDPHFPAFLDNKTVMHDHAQHRHFLIRMLCGGFPGDHDCPDNALTIAAWFH